MTWPGCCTTDHCCPGADDSTALLAVPRAGTGPDGVRVLGPAELVDAHR